MAGVTVAKYIRLWSGRTIPVTLIESNVDYTSNIMSNLVVTGQYSPTTLAYGWTNLVRNYGIVKVTGSVVGVEPGGALGAWKVTIATAAGPVERYCERVVLAPGIQFDPVPSTSGLASGAPVLHAWHAGAARALFMSWRHADSPRSGEHA